MITSQSTDSVSNGTDLFGNATTSRSHTDYQYGKFTADGGSFDGQTFWGVVDARGGGSAEGTDLFGGSYTSTSTTRFICINGRAFAKQIDTVTSSNDLFGGKTVTNTTTVNN